MLKGVVDTAAGTGTRASVPGYTVAGKTGTAQVALPHSLGYSTRNYVASFVGFLPADNPRVEVLVVVNSPRTNIFGGIVAAPAFQQIADVPDQGSGDPARQATRPPGQLTSPPGLELANLIGTIGPLEVRGGATGQITALTYDAAAAVPGALHFCVPGFRVDGHDFAGQAEAAGAVALVVERFLDIDLPQLLVRSSRAAMGPAADTFYGHPSHELDVIGVTGTNGKTTTCFLMYSVLEAAGLRPALLGTVESRIGGQVAEVKRTTPESIDLQAQFRQMADAGDQSCAMEVSSHALALERVAGTRFAAAAFTNLTQDHLDFHPTMEEYYLAKRRLFEDDAWPAAVNVADPYGRRLVMEAAGPVLSYARRRRRSGRRAPAVGRDRRGRGDLADRADAARPAAAGRAAARRLQRGQRALRGGAERAAGAAARGGAGRHRRASRGAGPLRAGGCRPAVHGAGRLRAHTRLARERAHGGAPHHLRRRDLRVRLRRRPRSRQAAADGRGRATAGRPRRSSPTTIRAARIRRRSPPRS